MKNILKKLGVIGLTIAVLAPFIDLPIVEAATSNCTKQLQNYLFLDQITLTRDSSGTGKMFEVYENNGYQTYTHFPYTFPESSNQTVNIKSVSFNNLNGDNKDKELDTYWSDYALVYNRTTNGEGVDSSKSGAIFVNNKVLTGGYDQNTILFHGVWDNVGSDGAASPEPANWSNFGSTGKGLSIQSHLSTQDAAKLKILLNGATFKSDKFTLGAEMSSNYLTNVVEIGTAKAQDSDYVWPDKTTNKLYLPLAIKRNYSDTSVTAASIFNNYIFGYAEKDATTLAPTGNVYVFSTSADKVENSYDALINNQSHLIASTTSPTSVKTLALPSGTGNVTKDNIDFDVTQSYYWPAVMSVEYELCTTETTATDKWTLNYDQNTSESVTGMPTSGTKYDLKANATVAEGPKSSKAFVEWCLNKDGKSGCYKPGSTLTSTVAETVTLYAQWGETGTTTNNKTGVVSYIIGFVSIGAIAGAIYIVSKKKNLFKQI